MSFRGARINVTQFLPAPRMYSMGGGVNVKLENRICIKIFIVEVKTANSSCDRKNFIDEVVLKLGHE